MALIFQVAPEDLPGAGREWHDALLGALAEDAHAPVAQVQVVDAQLAKLAGAQAGIDQSQDDGPVASRVGQRMHGEGLAGAPVRAGLAQGGEHLLDVVLGVGDDGALLGLGALDAAQQVAPGQLLLDGPGPQGGQAGVVIEQGLLGDGLAGEEAAHVIGGDLIQGRVVIQEESKLVEGVLIVGDGLLAQAAGLGCQLVAGNGF